MNPASPRQVLVTGGTSGIGAGIARAFAAHGDRVTVTGATEAEVARALAAEPGLQAQVLDVRDAAAGFAAAALGGAVGRGETCIANLGTSRTHSVEEVVAKLRRISGVPFDVVQTSERMRLVERPSLAADISRMRTMFGWQPRFNLDESLAALWSDPDLPARLVERYG
jgi:nucleoside-diphosphate-sugar epimerase